MSRGTGIAAALALSLLAGCAGSNTSGNGHETGEPAAAPPPEVAITVAEQGVTELPDEVSAGINTVTITNDGDGRLAPGFARINDGVKPEKVGVALTTGDFQTFFSSAVVAGAVFTSGEMDLLPGTSGSLTTELPEGTYIVADPESKRFEPGYFEVGPASGDEVEPPAAHFAIEEGEYFIEVDEHLEAGEHLVELRNVGEQGHELIVFEKKTEDEVAYAFAPTPGQTSWITLDLEPGTYEFACFFPDVKNGKLGKKNHAALGMKTTVTIE